MSQANKFVDHWVVAKTTKDTSIYFRAVDAMLQSASTAKEHNLATDLSLNGKRPELIAALDQVTGTKETA